MLNLPIFKAGGGTYVLRSSGPNALSRLRQYSRCAIHLSSWAAHSQGRGRIQCSGYVGHDKGVVGCALLLVFGKFSLCSRAHFGTKAEDFPGVGESMMDSDTDACVTLDASRVASLCQAGSWK